MIIVSTDGSCLRNPGGAIGWAWVNHEGPTMSGGESSGTNQIAELRALFEAVVAHPGDEPLLIESDSQYAIKCASEWLPSWKRKGWKTASGGAVKNLELVQGIDRVITDRVGPVRFRWVRGHVGNHYNEVADKLAGEAARAIVSGDIASVPLAVPTAELSVKKEMTVVNPSYKEKSTTAIEPEDLFTLF
ncbi:ribonuclease H [Rhodococcus sp. ARC_M6]|uniref:ribonuclease H family protein n=1 Tax=Rhodococcus sp. ARC_M6 TaxID=2928852 RepID=UPI001FB48AE4|nr:ribonuclease H [Rhodococcus sp. ARC_M6]MCJ0905389.1 ribonuclease HI [Rhodococcus sp. ARC_M6]